MQMFPLWKFIAQQCGVLVLGAGDRAEKKIDENFFPHEANNENGWNI